MTRHTATLTAETQKNIPDPTLRVRRLNDDFRRDIFNSNLGELFYTAGVAALKDEAIFALVREVQTYEDFNPNNDPYGEHDFGSIKMHGIKYFWKIDYYDKTKTFHSPDKANPNLTIRVLTIMQASEY